MKTLIWLWVTAAGLSLGICQNREIDSLRDVLNRVKIDGTDRRPEINSQLGWHFYNRASYDSAIFYYKKALETRYENPNLLWSGNVHYGLGASFAALNRFDSSVSHYETALGFFLSVYDDKGIAAVSTNLSIAYKNLGLYEEALESSLTAARIFEKQEPSFNLAACYNTIGQILTKIENYDEAVKFYRKAITLFKNFNEQYQARSYNNLGELFILTRQYDSARSNLLHGLEIKRKYNDTKGVARTLNNLAKVSMLMKDLDLAEQQLNESHQMLANVDDPIRTIEVFNNLSELYLITKRYNKSYQTLKEAEHLIRTAGTPDYLRDNLELQVRLAEERKDFANGMKLLKQLADIRDSLLSEEKTKSLQAMQIRYESEKKEQEIALFRQREEINQAEIRTKEVVIGSLLIGLLLVAAIGGLIYINLKNARASKNKIELLLSETRHRFKNNLQTLASIFNLQTRHYTDREMVLEARSSESRVHTMSLLHDKFSAAEPGSTVRTRTYVTDLIHMLVDIYGSKTSNLALAIKVDDIDLDIDKAFALSLIIQELVCNSFKYAFDHQPRPKLSVTVNANNDEITASIRDNGIGLSDISARTSQGFNLVDALVAQLDGSMQVVVDDGTTFIIKFPLVPAWKKRLF